MYKISYTGNGADTEFTFSFPFFQNADVKVAFDNVLLNADDYDVNPNDNFTGGLVVFSAAPAQGVQIDIFRQISLNRVIDYQPTAKIDPEDLNSDFNFLLAAFQDLRKVDVDLSEWANIHDTVLSKIDYTINLIEDKLSGGGVLGLYNNLLSVLNDLINDYGSVSEEASDDDDDDYGSI